MTQASRQSTLGRHYFVFQAQDSNSASLEIGDSRLACVTHHSIVLSHMQDTEQADWAAKSCMTVTTG